MGELAFEDLHVRSKVLTFTVDLQIYILTSNSFLKKACPASAFFFKKLTNSIFYTRIM